MCYGVLIINNILDWIYGNYEIEMIPFNQWNEIAFHMFMLENKHTAYAPIFVYQLSMPLLTLVKHDIIDVNMWNIYYSKLIILTMLATLTTQYDFAPFCFVSIWFAKDNYSRWPFVYLLHYLYKVGINQLNHVPDDFTYYPIAYFLLFCCFIQWSSP